MSKFKFSVGPWNIHSGAATWLYAGGAHHTVVSTQSNVNQLNDLAKLYDMEVIVIDESTDLRLFEQNLKISDSSGAKSKFKELYGLPFSD